jgi:hypothetical protein
MKITTARPMASIGDENASCAPAPTHRERRMLVRQGPEQSSTFEYRLAQEAINLRKQAKGMPLGVRRDELLRKARQIDVAVEVNTWLTSPRLRAPT